MAKIDQTQEEGEEHSGPGGVMAIQLVLEILEVLAKQESVGVTEVAKKLHTTKARVYRHLRTLVDRGYAVQDKNSDRYAIGPRLFALSRIAVSTPEEGIVRLARPTIRRLRDEFGHTVNLSCIYGDSVSIVETLSGNSLVGVVMQTHAAMPLHSTAAGKLLLAERFAKDEQLPPDPYEKFTENTITDADALRSELARINKQGWAGAPEEIVLGINAISAPVRDHNGELVSMISLISSIQFISRHPSRDLVEGIKGAAKEISEMLRL